MMAQAQALPTTPTSPSIRNLLVNCKLLTLKAFGTYGDIVVYHIFEGDQVAGPHIAYSNPIVCIIEARDATQEFKVKLNENGPVLLKAKNGIVSPQDKMSIFNPNTNVQVAELTNTHALDYSDRQNTLIFNYSPKDPGGRCTFRTAKGTRILGLIHQNKTTSYAKFDGVPATGIQKVLAMMALVKFYYAVYRFHLIPKPVDILGRLPAGTPLRPTIRLLETIANIILRPACQTASARYIEVLDFTTHRITMVIEQYSSMTSNFKLSFRDSFGTMLFRCERMGTTDYVRTPTGMLIGSHIPAGPGTIHFFDALTNTPIMTQQPKGPSPNTHRRITSASYNNAVVTEITQLGSNTMLGVYITETIPIEHKALILSSVSIASLAYYYIFNTPTPDMAAYPYRQTSK